MIFEWNNHKKVTLVLKDGEGAGNILRHGIYEDLEIFMKGKSINFTSDQVFHLIKNQPSANIISKLKEVLGAFFIVIYYQNEKNTFFSLATSVKYPSTMQKHRTLS